MTTYKKEKKNQKNREVENQEYWESRQNLYGFFSILLKVDRRINPHLYKNKT